MSSSNSSSNSSNNIYSGMTSQLFTNSNHNSGSELDMFIFGYAVGNKILDFTHNHILNLSRDFASYVPQYLVMNLYSYQNQNLSNSELLRTVCNLLNKIRIIMQVSDQTILQLPLSLLHELKPAEIHDHKIYFHIPFSSFFSAINFLELYNSTVTFIIQDFNELSNYANNFSLVTKVYVYGSEERNRMLSVSSHRFIQQIGTLHVSNRQISSHNFQIQTNILNGPTKGFLLQCCVQDLTSIKFYINNLMRIDYNRFLILTTCVKLSDHLLYIPITDHSDFKDKGTNTYAGAINLSRLQNSTMCLQFSTDQSKVVIHNVYANHFRQVSGLGGLDVDYRPAFIETTTDTHPVGPIIGTPLNTGMLDMSGNYINRTPGFFDMSSNYIHDHIALNSRMTGSSTGSSTGTSTGSSTGTSTGTSTGSDIVNPITGYTYSGNFVGLTGSGSGSATYGSGSATYGSGSATYGSGSGSSGFAAEPEYPIPNGQVFDLSIDPDNNICNITLEDILLDYRYMTCPNCVKNFSEIAIKRWLRRRTGNLRNCPTCRVVWTNFNVYVNVDLNHDSGPMPELINVCDEIDEVD